jgi:protein-S-isoprenylcysteine O-methyltransferase Ste14
MYLALAVVETMGFYLVMGAVLFGSAGNLKVPAFWTYLAAMSLLSLLSLILVYQRSPDLIKERLRPGKGEQDKWSLKAMILFFFLHLAIAGLDARRHHGTPPLTIELQVLGLILYATGFGIVLWAMLANPFFSSAVRIQTDRGQYVITSGPYQFVRHPGYTGGFLFLLSSGLALGSCFAVLPMFAVMPFLFRRTLLEDRMLQRELPGYTDYVRKVPYRLIPGIW